MQITFWGTRGSIPSPGPDTVRYGGNTSCVEVLLDDGTLLIFDAGTGIRALGNALLTRAASVRAYLFLSHMHWDHIQGLPFFTPSFIESTELRILGPEEAHLSLEPTICDQMRRPYYPIPMHAMAAKMQFIPLTEGSVFSLPEAIVKVSRLNHPGRTLGYRLTMGKKVIVYATDNEPFGKEQASRHLVEPSDLLHLAHHADVLIQDAQYTPKEYPQRLGWGHSTYVDALCIAQQAQVKRLVLYHHDPSHTDTDIDSIMAHCRAWMESHKASFTCIAAAEGTSIIL
ncbi:MAG: MBL fold metallo-hydrolase [Candidatus Tectomicrobia bacterium]